MKLVDKVNEDIKTAMLAKEKEKLEAIRAIKSAILLAQTSGEAQTEDSDIKLLQKLVKQRRESAEIYKGQGRADLVDKETFEADIIETYLPAQLSDEELEKIIRAAMLEVNALSVRDMGNVMKAANPLVAGKADGKRISEMVKKLLSI